MTRGGWPEHGPFLIAGPCAVESDAVMLAVGERLATIANRHAIPVWFKASFDKANRSNHGAARGPGIEQGLRAMERVRAATGLPLITDIHLPDQAAAAAQVVDALQIPAFLCRQTDLLSAAGSTGLPVNIKKGQWMAPESMAGAVDKARSSGSTSVAVTERGTFFGYGDLVVDFRALTRLRTACSAPVVYDATHSVQQPGRGDGGASGGLREHIPTLLAAAAAAGADGYFIETHPDPASAISDAATQWPLDRLEALIARTLAIRAAARESTLA